MLILKSQMTGKRKRCSLQGKLASKGKTFQDVLVTGILNVWGVFFLLVETTVVLGRVMMSHKQLIKVSIFVLRYLLSFPY